MSILRFNRLLSIMLCAVLASALLMIAPFYERQHVMSGVEGGSAMAQAMPMHEAMPLQPLSHGSHEAACRILCFGWTEATTPERQEGQAIEIASVFGGDPVPLFEGISPPPNGHPPKPAPFV